MHHVAPTCACIQTRNGIAIHGITHHYLALIVGIATSTLMGNVMSTVALVFTSPPLWPGI